MMTRTPSDVAFLIPTSSSSSIYPVYRRRFYVLFIFAFLAFNQCLFWLTFSPISQSTQTYYHINESTVNLLLNWGPIIFIPCLPLAYILLNKRHGLRRTVVLLAVTDFIAIFLRIFPSMIVSSSNPYFTSISLLFIHIGQILNAACGPLVMAPVSQLSCLWFKPDERTRATTLAIMAGNFGSTVGFLISPWIVITPEHVPNLLYIHLILAFIPLVFILVYFPAHPPQAPSPAAQLLIDTSMNEENTSSLRSYIEDIWRCVATPSFTLLCSVGGLLGGAFAAWTGLFANILAIENFTEKQSGKN
jgi:nitrate/nitrite transporter NarK